MRLNGSAGSTLLDLAWNPAIPSLLVTCLSDGRLDMFDITDKLGIKANIPGANARCGKKLLARLYKVQVELLYSLWRPH